LNVGVKKVFALLGVIAFVGCTNDYDQFDLGNGAAGDSAGSLVQHDSGNDRSAVGAGGGASGSEDTGSEPADAGDESADVSADAAVDASDASGDGAAPADVTAEASTDAAADRTIDAPADAADATVDTGVHSGTDAAESGADAPAALDAPAEADVAADVNIATEADAPGESAAPPDDAAAEADDSTVTDAVEIVEAEAGVSCEAGTKPCGNGCVSITDPATGCAGASCAPCALPHASSTCGATGECAVMGCAAGYDDCDTLATNGCEVLLSIDVANCGSCGRACAATDVLSKQCAGGLCVSTCNAGHANCSYPYSAADDGCEAAADSTHCGNCSNDCTKQGSGFTCGAAVPSQCGCITDNDCRVTGSMGTCDVPTGRCVCDVTTCGAGEACKKLSGPVPDVCSCNGGNPCSANQTCCQSPGGCKNLQTDPSSCGVCGRVCPNGFFCSAGQCECGSDLECNAGTAGTCAAGQCVCGAITCPKGQRCQASGTCG